MTKREKDIVEVKTEELSTFNIIKTEANLSGLPFFALSRREVRTRSKTEYKVVIERNGEKLNVLWRVSGSAEYGYPGPFDRKVHKALEYIINEQGIPVENPIPFSIYQLCRLMEVANSGTNKKRVTQALRRIVATTVDSEGTFYSKKEKRYITDTFHIYDRVVFKGRVMSNGNIAERNYLYLSQWYLESINAFYVRPIDFNYFRRLQSDIAGRLYELLGLKFHGVILNGRPYWKVDYKELCNLLPVTEQRYLSDAKRYLKPAHAELKKTRFLDKVRWNTQDRGHWYILYYPGEKAIEDTKPKVVQEELQLEAPQPTSESREEIPSNLSSGEKALFRLLADRKIAQESALKIVKTHPDRIREKVETFDWLAEADSNLIDKNPAGYLRKSIEENWDPPPGFVSKAERERKAQEKEKASLLEDLETLTIEEDQKSELLKARKDDVTKEEIQKEIAQIKAERERSKKEEKAKIRELLSSMTQEELNTLKKEVLSKVDNFHKKQSNYRKVASKEIRNLEGRGLTESYIRDIRDRIIKEKYLKDKL